MPASTQATIGSDLLRGGEYTRHVRETFVGVEPTQLPGSTLQGNVTISVFGAGRIASMRGCPALIQRKTVSKDATSATFNLFVNVQGSVELEHCAQVSELTAGDVLFLDGSRTFAANIRNDYRQILVQFPRDTIARRHPQLITRAGICFSREHPAVQILAENALMLTSRTSSFDAVTRSCAYDAMLAMLGALQSATVEQGSVAGHRLVRALADVDAHLSDANLSAATLATLQGISRRRLDAIFATRGLTAERVIWTRRLERAASEIISSHARPRKLLEIALDCGFLSEAHFSRKFREHFGLSPREYQRVRLEGLPAAVC